MIDNSYRSGTAKVQTLIERFELMAQVNASRLAKAPMSTPDSSAVKEIVDKMNAQQEEQETVRARTRSEPVQMAKVEETPEVEGEKPTESVATPIVKSPQILTVKTMECDDDDDTTTLSSYEEESDMELTSPMRSDCYSVVPRSPSAYSTASTGSLDSLLSSLDMFLPELLQASGEIKNSEITRIKIVKPAVRPTRRSSLPEDVRPVASKLVPPASYRRASLSGKSPAMPTKNAAPTATKPRRSSLYSKNAAQAPSAIPRPRRSSLSATSVPPAIKSTRRFSESARSSPPIVVTSPRANSSSRSDSSPVPRYLDYDHSPRFAATKARNLERRRQLEQRNRNLAADKVKQLSSNSMQRPRSSEWQGRLDQVRSRLFDFQDDPQWSTAVKETHPRATKSKTKSVRSRLSSGSSRARV